MSAEGQQANGFTDQPIESNWFSGLLSLLIPVILVYTAYSYWVFRGKVGADAGYH